MTIREQDITYRNQLKEQRSNRGSTEFEDNFYRALGITPIKNVDIEEDQNLFRKQVTSTFPEEFFTEENEVTAAQKLTKALVSSWPKEIPPEQFSEGEKCIKKFCVQAIPVLQASLPHFNADTLGHHLITSSIIAHAKLREAYGITPIPNTERIRMHLDISKALEVAEEPVTTVSKAGKEEIPIFVRS